MRTPDNGRSNIFVAASAGTQTRGAKRKARVTAGADAHELIVHVFLPVACRQHNLEALDWIIQVVVGSGDALQAEQF